MPPTLSLQKIRALRPCDYASHSKMLRKFGKGPYTAADAVAAGVALGDLIWVVSAVALKDPDIERRLRLWIADCAAHVLHIFETKHPADNRPREAIIAARRFARGEISAAAGDAAWAAGAAAWAAARAAAGAAARDAAGAAAWAAEDNWQKDRLVKWLSDKEPRPHPISRKA